MSLWSEFLTNKQRAIHKWKHYFPAYETHFGRFVNRPITFIEIGCGRGGSLQMWKRYFGPHARIIGIDIRPEVKQFEEDQIEIRIGDQSDTSFLESVIQEFGTPDVVLDDGSHVMDHLVKTFHYLYPRTAPDGVYLVEDLHTAYWDEFGGGVKRDGSFIELCKSLIDELNADWSRDVLPPTDFTRSTLSMHFYDSMAVFERGRHLTKTAPVIGAPENRFENLISEAKSKLLG
jgi:SAM-dependent methyltransferase